MPKVSIIVPIYNVERYLDRCMDSLLHQTLEDIELILVDDGSPDQCPQMCEKYAELDSRVKVVHKKNAGLGLARNSGLGIATGEYVAFIDSDDFVDLDMYGTLYAETEKYPYDAVYCGYNVEVFPGKFEPREVYEKNLLKKSEITDFLAEMTAAPVSVRQYRRINMAVWRAIYRRELLVSRKIQFHSEREILSEDIVFDYDFFEHCTSVRYVPRAMQYYCSNQGSLTHTYNVAKLQKIQVLVSFLFDKAKIFGDNEELFKQRICRLFVDYNASFVRKILLSANPWAQKKKDCQVLFDDSVWLIVQKIYLTKGMPLLNKLKYKFMVDRNVVALYALFHLLKVARK